MTHKQRTQREGPDLVFGRTKTEAFFASTIRARSNKAWEEAGLEPITPHEARHCAIAYSSRPDSTGSRSRPGPAMAMSARRGTATGTSYRVAKRRRESASMPI